MVHGNQHRRKADEIYVRRAARRLNPHPSSRAAAASAPRACCAQLCSRLLRAPHRRRPSRCRASGSSTASAPTSSCSRARWAGRPRRRCLPPSWCSRAGALCARGERSRPRSRDDSRSSSRCGRRSAGGSRACNCSFVLSHSRACSVSSGHLSQHASEFVCSNACAYSMCAAKSTKFGTRSRGLGLEACRRLVLNLGGSQRVKKATF